MRLSSVTRPHAGHWVVAAAVLATGCHGWAQCLPSISPACASVPPIPLGARPETGAYYGNQHQSGALFVHSLEDRQGGWGWQPRTDTAEPQRGVFDLRAGGTGDRIRGDIGGFDIDSRTAWMQGTATLGQWSPFGRSDRMHFGAMFGYGGTRSDAQGVPAYFQSQGNTSGYSVGAFGTWYQDDLTRTGWYSDLWGQYAVFSDRVQTVFREQVDYNSHAGILSAEGGYVVRLQDSSWSLVPQGQFVYVHNHTYNVTQLDGLQVDGAHRGGWLSRLGVRAEHEAFGWAGGVVRPSVTLNWWHDALGDEVVVNNVSTRYLYPSDRFEFKAGVDARFQGGWMAWGNVGWQMGSQSYQAWTVQAGTRFVWR